ncbi:MAG: biopolymer transporter ExbD [Ignavibacteriae bacterium]|nr:biopolymer transporter ExbD [Ignavibacteriota bacterium]
MSGFSNSDHKGVKIDMTPMVDVIMLLLTFFMLTTALTSPQIMQINLPKGTGTVTIDASNVLHLRVSEKGNIYLSHGRADGGESAPKNVAFTDLRSTLEDIYLSNPNISLLLKFDRGMRYNDMVDVIDEINNAHIPKRYAFIHFTDSDMQIVKLAGG